MFKALLFKHLKQARIVVWTGIAFTLAIPLLVGLLVRMIWGEQPPVGRDFLSAGWGAVLVIGFWPLWMLLTTLQIFAGDQACQTENFLLERPIRPRAVWWSRTTASWIAFGVFFLATFFGWWLGARILGGQSHTTISDNMSYMLQLGAVLLPLVFSAGALAAACGLSGFNGLYLAAALTGLPLLPAFWFISRDISPRFAMNPWMIPVTLVEAFALIYGLTAFAMQARGEPQGRNKFRRGGLVFGTGLVSAGILLAAVVGLHLYITPFRWAAIQPSPTGKAAVVNRLWNSSLFDITTGRRLQYWEGVDSRAQWNSKGDRLAVLDSGSSFSRMRSPRRLRIFDLEGKQIGTDIYFERPVDEIAWSHDRIIVVAWGSGGAKILYRVIPGHHDIPLEVGSFPLVSFVHLLGDPENGSLMIAVATKDPKSWKKRPHTEQTPDEWDLWQYDPRGERFAPFLSEKLVWSATFVTNPLSPSGRFVVSYDRDGNSLHIHRLEGGQDIAVPVAGQLGWRFKWTADDSLLWWEREPEKTNLYMRAPDKGKELLWSGKKGSYFTLEVSPGGRKVFWGEWDRNTAQTTGVLRLFATGKKEISTIPLAKDQYPVGWWTENSIAVMDGKRLFAIDIDHPDQPRKILGSGL